MAAVVSSLDSILSDEKPAPTPAAVPEAAPAAPAPKEAPAASPAAAPAATVPAAETPKEPARGADGKFVKPADKPAAPAPQAPQPEMTERERAFLRAAQEERAKRQEFERKLAEVSKPPAQPPEKPKAFWDDPEGALRRHAETVQEQNTHTRLNTAELIARSRYTDFDEKVAEFSQLVTATPGLAQQWLASPDPAEFAYVTAKNHMLLKQAGSLDALTAKVRAETEAAVRTKVEAEFKAKAEALEKERAALPPSLSDTRGGAGGGGKPVWNGPTPLADILK